MSLPTATPENPAQRYSTLLTRLIGGGDWERALGTARSWLAEDPESVSAHLAAGQALVNLKQYAQAQPHLLKALAGNPRHGFAHRLASIVFFHQKKFSLADEHIQQALSLQPNDAIHWYHLAWMRYRQGALDLAAKHAGRALELQPNSADTINLLALCERRDGKAQLAQYRRALELDPGNSVVHNNIGTYYLDVDRDYEAAEASFRQALVLNPSDKTAQRNLFIALRHRDKFYRVLTLPRTLVGKLSWNRADRSILAKAALLLLWLFAGRIFLGLLILWFALVYPLLKAYEYLTLGDLRAQAGVPGARRGGLLGYRRWPFAARLGIFAAMTLLFWGAVYLFFGTRLFSKEAVAVILGLGISVFFCLLLLRSWRRFHRWWIVRRAERKLNRKMPVSNA